MKQLVKVIEDNQYNLDGSTYQAVVYKKPDNWYVSSYLVKTETSQREIFCNFEFEHEIDALWEARRMFANWS